MKILLIEDEPNVISFVRRGLMEAGHEVSVAMDGVTGLQMIQSAPPDVVLLDVMLPGMNGVDLCRKARHLKLGVPIIMLTALGTSENIVTGLETGADDYIVKPFKFTELLARISAVARRSHGKSAVDESVIKIDDLALDTRGKMVVRSGERINLTATEYNLLEFLSRNTGRVFSRLEILEKVWDINFNTNTNVVDVYINHVRRKIDKPGAKKLIHTVVGMGYVLRRYRPASGMKIRTKIALVFTLMTATILFMLSAFVYVVSSRHMEEYFLTHLNVRVSIAAAMEFEDETDLVREFRARHLQKLPREKEWFFEDSSSFPVEVLNVLPRVPGSFIETLTRTGSAESREGFEYYTGIRHQAASTNGKYYFVIASAYDESGEENLRFLRTILITGFSVSCVLVFALGRLFANRIMKPIARIISKVHEITTTNLSERLDTRKGKDEITEMAETFNNMLDRLETTFELQSNFIGNASHELNTPLTAILGEVEIILSAARKQEEYVESLKVIDYEAKKLRDVTSSLLRLSSISYEGKKQKIERLQLDELLMDIKISFDRRMPANKVRVLIQAHEWTTAAYCVVGSSVWLELAITNVIQNSIKYSDNKEVLVTLSANERHCFIEISDQGIGILEEDMRYVFEPFFRGSNTGAYKGYGIGLPLAARIVRLHAGELQIFSKPNAGTKVTLKFPASRDT